MKKKDLRLVDLELNGLQLGKTFVDNDNWNGWLKPYLSEDQLELIEENNNFLQTAEGYSIKFTKLKSGDFQLFEEIWEDEDGGITVLPKVKIDGEIRYYFGDGWVFEEVWED